MKSERNAPSRLALTSQEERQRFFDETRERILQSRLDDPFGQFVRDHQERFAALTATIMGENNSGAASPATNNAVEVGKLKGAESVLNATSSREAGSSQDQQSAADLVASILNGESANFSQFPHFL